MNFFTGGFETKWFLRLPGSRDVYTGLTNKYTNSFRRHFLWICIRLRRCPKINRHINMLISYIVAHFFTQNNGETNFDSNMTQTWDLEIFNLKLYLIVNLLLRVTKAYFITLKKLTVVMRRPSEFIAIYNWDCTCWIVTTLNI